MVPIILGNFYIFTKSVRREELVAMVHIHPHKPKVLMGSIQSTPRGCLVESELRDLTLWSYLLLNVTFTILLFIQYIIKLSDCHYGLTTLHRLGLLQYPALLISLCHIYPSPVSLCVISRHRSDMYRDSKCNIVRLHPIHVRSHCNGIMSSMSITDLNCEMRSDEKKEFTT